VQHLQSGSGVICIAVYGREKILADYGDACMRRFLLGGMFMDYIMSSLPSVAGGNLGSVCRTTRWHHGVVIFLKTSSRPFGERLRQQLEVGKVKRWRLAIA
jgi:hypothetical protein